jgi:hypothetical protein
MRIAVYVSNHGFGHAARMIALVREVLTAGSECAVIGNCPRFLFQGLEDPALTIRESCLDFGMLERDWRTPDPAATADRFVREWSARGETVAREARFLREWGADLAIADVPPMALDIAREAAVPLIVITNFDWEYIYRNMLPNTAAIRIALDEYRNLASGVKLALRLPFSTPASLDAFPRCEVAGILAPEARSNRRRLSRELQIQPTERIVAVVSRTGGEFPIPRICNIPGVTVVSSIPCDHPSHRLIPRDFDYPRLLASADIVLTRAGYSTLAGCVQSGTFTVYTDREAYVEDPLLIEEMRRYGHGVHIPCAELPGFDWEGLFARIGRPGKKRLTRYRNANRRIAARCLAEAAPETGRRIAVIDTGSNMMSVLWAIIDDTGMNPVFQTAAVTGLSKGMKNGLLRPVGIRRARKVMAEYLRMTRDFTGDIRVIGAQSARRASNIGELTDWLQRRFGLEFETISGEVEAECAGLVAAGEFPEHFRLLSFDVGGGSTEFAFVDHGEIIRRISLPLGLRQLENDFGDDRQRIRHYIRRTLAGLSDWETDDAELISIGGSGTNLAVFKHGMRHYSPSAAHGARIDLADLAAFRKSFGSMTAAETRNAIPFDPERPGIILSGVAILEEVLALFGRDHVIICERGLPYGYLHRLIRMKKLKSVDPIK